MVWQWDGEAFGNTPPNTNPSGLGNLTFNLRFPGQYADSETGLNNNYFRDYDPTTGRYIESDPIGLKGGSASTFIYVANTPLSKSDPFGLLIRGTGVTDDQWAAIQAAQQKIQKELEKDCGKDCIRAEDRAKIQAALATTVVNQKVTIITDGVSDCAVGTLGGSSMTLASSAYNVAKCGCLASTVYHKLLHNIGYSHGAAPDAVNTRERLCKANLCGP